MDYEKARKELKDYPKLKKKSSRLSEQQEELQEKILSAGGQKIYGMPSSQGKISDLSDYMVHLEKISDERALIEKKITDIETRVALIDDLTLSELIEQRYIKEKCWAEVGNEFNRSESWAKNKNKCAIMAYANAEEE